MSVGGIVYVCCLSLFLTLASADVRVGIMNKLEEAMLVYDQTADQGKSPQQPAQALLTISPGSKGHFTTTEKQFFRLVPEGKDWHDAAIHVVTSGKNAVGRDFEIGFHGEEWLKEHREMMPDLPEEMREVEEQRLEEMRAQSYNIETAVYATHDEL